MIQRHEHACVTCQQYNCNRKKKKPRRLDSVPPTAIRFSVISMDFWRPIMSSLSENRYVLLVTDLFTRFVSVVASPSNTAKITALTLLRDIFCTFVFVLP
jgi:hypothetical protein